MDTATAPMKMGSTRRWKLIPDALAAVISAWRVNAPIEKTVAKRTEAGSAMNIESGIQYR